MSVGQLCKTCGEGRVRPFQCSLDQAVVRCDNADCDSYLEIPPWDCVIKHTITSHKKRQSVFSGNQHYRAWSCSSSGTLSDFRSQVESLGEPCYSRTDRSHNLLPKENKYRKSVPIDVSHTSETEENHWNTDSSDTFFSLLHNLDLKSILPETRNEATSALLLESWMETFDCNTSVSNGKPSGKDGNLSKEQDQTLICEQESFISQTLSEHLFENQSGNSDCFNGQSSNICLNNSSSGDRSSHVKEDQALCDKQFMSPAASAASDDSGFDDEANKIKSVVLPAVEEESFEQLLREHPETPKDKTVRSIHSFMSYNFEDLLCEENKGPAPPDVLNFNVHPVMVTVEKCGNVDEVEPQRGTDTSSSVVRSQDTEGDDKPSRDITSELHENLNCFEATSVEDCGTSASDSSTSEKGCHTIQSVPGSLCSIEEINVEANADQPSINTLESENVSSDISSQNITVLTADAVEDVSENCTFELTTDGLSTNFDNSNEQHHVRGKQSRGKHRGRGRGRRRGRCRVAGRSQETQRSDETGREQSEDRAEDGLAQTSSSSEARGKGSHRGQGRGTRKPKVNLKVVPRQTRQRTGTIEVQAPRTNKRPSDEISSDDHSSTGLRSGLSSLLQGANQYRYDDRRKETHNITNLSFRSLLKGPVAEDPWSVPEWHLEGLDIEIIVQGVRRKSHKNESRESPDTEKAQRTEDRAAKSEDDNEKNIEEETDMGNGRPCSSLSASRTSRMGDAEEEQVLNEELQGASVPDNSIIVIHKGDSAIDGGNQSGYSSEEKERFEGTVKIDNTSFPSILANHSLENSSVNARIEVNSPRSLGENESKQDSYQSHTATESSISSSQSENPNVCTSLQKLNLNIIPKENLYASEDFEKDLGSLSEQQECNTHSENKLESQAFDISNRVLVVETALSKNSEVTSGANKDNSDILSNDKEESYSSVSLCSETPATSGDLSIDMNESVRKVESLNTTIFPPTLRDTVKENNEEASGITETTKNNQDSKRTDNCTLYAINNSENNVREIDACSDKFEYLENLLRSFESNVQVLEVTESKKFDEKVASDFPKTKEPSSTVFMENSVSSTNSKPKLQSREAQEVPNTVNLHCGVPEHQNITHVKAVASPSDELEDGDRLLLCEDNEEPNSSPPAVENSPSTSPHYFMVLPDHGEVRTWMGFKKAVNSDGQIPINEAETSNTETTENNKDLETTENNKDLKRSSKELPSTYFNTLLKDLNFDETFFHCPVKEQPESTFVEHLSSSLFFGETADTSLIHPVQGAFCHTKRQGDCTNKSPNEKEFELNNISGDKGKDSQNVEIKQSVACLLTNNNAIAKQSVSETKAVVLPYTNNANTKQSVSKAMAVAILCKSNVNTIQSVSETLAVSPLLTSGDLTSSNKPNVNESCSKHINEGLCIFEGGGELNKSKRKGDFCDGRVINLPSKLESENILLNPKTRSSNKSKMFEIVQHSSASSLSANNMKASTFSEKLGAMQNCKLKEVSKKRKLSDSKLEDTKRSLKNTNQASMEGVHSFEKKDFFTVVKTEQSETLEKVCLENNLVLSVKEECINENDEEMPIVSLDDDDIQIIVPEKKCKVEKDDISVQCDIIKKENKVDDFSADIDLNYAAQIEDAEPKIRAGSLPIKGSLSSNNCDILPEKRDSYTNESSETEEDNFLTCGILDNSIPHDKKCYSPRMKVFVDFEDSFEDGEAPSSLKVYYGTRKRKYEICKDLNIDFDLSESPHKNSDELTTSVLSPSHVSRTDTFTYNPGFGCTKFSPQHDETDSVKDERVSDLGVQDFDDIPSFLSDSPSSESSISPSYSNSVEYFGNIKSTGDDWESSGVGGKGDESIIKNTISKRGIMYQASLEPKAETSESGWPGGESSGCSEFHLQNTQLENTSSESSLTLSLSSRQINRTVSIHNLTQTPETKQESGYDVDTPTEKQLKRDARVLILPRNNSCHIPIVPAVPIKKAVSNDLPIPMLGFSTSSSGTSPYHSLNPSTTSVALNSLTHSNLGQNICSKNTGLTQVGLGHQALWPPLHHTPIQAPGNLVNSEPSTLPRIPVSQVFDCTNNSNILGSPHVLGMANRNPNIDYKIPQQSARPIIVPPALASSYKNDFLQEREISEAVSNRQSSERIIAVTRQTSAGPVTRLLRVSTLAERGSDALQDKSFDGESSGSEVIDKKPSAATHCNSEEKNQDLLQNNMIKKVKMGSKGSFYLRPSPALMNAIAELRSKGNLPAGNRSKVDRSDVIELPDGRPISPPIHIQSKVVQKKRRRKRRQMDIRERQIKRLAKEKVQETMERSKIDEDIPEMVAVCLGGKLHIYHRKDVH
ncbi:uncharacterized protein LOC125042985 isoform X2 [Penaeus chinensis]|uniref:uncharacterized protein LOC125042985 isoform X2 n=1 Tax=Penaeus chinensis TaxID=139456 RepID=UPI001FB5A038|nr:uncharacterized protein LOC125042985 isoform X2 [Penaeus chinensis]